jgi:hypothetical protein
MRASQTPSRSIVVIDSVGRRVREWMEKRCSRKIFHKGVPSLTSDFSLAQWLRSL